MDISTGIYNLGLSISLFVNADYLQWTNWTKNELGHLSRITEILAVTNVFKWFMLSRIICTCSKKTKKYTAISQIKKIPFSKNIRFYYVIFIYSCMHVKVKYYTKFQDMQIGTTLFALYLHVLTCFLICF